LAKNDHLVSCKNKKAETNMINRSDSQTNWKRTLGSLAIVAMLMQAGVATAGIHTWDVVEVFSNADGTIQYVELLDRGSTNPALGSETGVGSSSISSSLTSFFWSGSVSIPTNTRSFLIATAAFAALPGAPTPDVIIPPANIPFFDVAGDTVTFSTVDPLAFGAVPTNGIDSLTEPTAGAGLVVGTNTPRNYAGATGTVNAAPGVPSGSLPMILGTTTLLLAVGFAFLNRRQSAAG
jgi:serralysin